MRFCSFLFLLLTLTGAAVANDNIVLPLPPAPTPAPLPPPNPNGVAVLKGDSLFVINCKVDCVIRSHPAGLVKTTVMAGPATLFGKFVDSPEASRTFNGKQVLVVQAAGKGRVEIDVIPLKFADEKEIVTVVLDVDNVRSDCPDPKPNPDPKPLPPVGTVAWAFIVEETTTRTPAVTAIINDAKYWDGLASKNIKSRFYDKDSPDAKSKNFDKFASEVGYPALLLMAADGKKLKAVKLPTTTAGITSEIEGVK